MKRFIRYLYEYQDGKRTRNVGFVKVESGTEGTTVHIHGKGLRLDGDSALVVYLFYEEDGQCIGISQGETSIANPTINCRLFYTSDDTGEAQNYSRIQGILLKSSSGKIFAALWDEKEVDVCRMKEWEARPVEEPDICREMTEIREETIEACEKSEEPEKEISKRIRIHKIQRHELSRLARCDWNLSNNQFLLHGYYNYRHLGLVENEEGWKLGVPGIWHEQEERSARIFGFGEFLPIEETEISLQPEEKNDEEPFGYWCRKVKMCRAVQK